MIDTMRAAESVLNFRRGGTPPKCGLCRLPMRPRDLVDQETPGPRNAWFHVFCLQNPPRLDEPPPPDEPTDLEPLTSGPEIGTPPPDPADEPPEQAEEQPPT